MKYHGAADYDKRIPVIELNEPGQPAKLVIISLNDIQRQVGLVQSSVDSLEHKVVSPYIIFNDDMKETAGQLKYIL